MMGEMPGPRCLTLLHATSLDCIAAMKRVRLVVPALSTRAEDGVLAQPSAPLVIWFMANTETGRRRMKTSYPERLTSDKVPVLAVDVDRLLSSDDAGAKWELFRLTSLPDSAFPSASSPATQPYHVKYAMVAADSPEWCWLQWSGCTRIPAGGDHFVRLMQVGTNQASHGGWMYYARDAVEAVEISVAFVPPKSAPVRIELFDAEVLWLDKAAPGDGAAQDSQRERSEQLPVKLATSSSGTLASTNLPHVNAYPRTRTMCKQEVTHAKPDAAAAGKRKPTTKRRGAVKDPNSHQLVAGGDPQILGDVPEEICIVEAPRASALCPPVHHTGGKRVGATSRITLQSLRTSGLQALRRSGIRV